MKIMSYGCFVIAAVIVWMSTAWGQPLQATQATEVIGGVCQTMDEHPADPVYNVMDFAICGPGGLRVYPEPSVAAEFNKIKKGVQGKKPGNEIVYLHGFMRTKVMEAFGTPNTPSWRPRFRYSWLEVDSIRRGISLVGKPRVKREGGVARVSIDVTNPLDKPIMGTEAVLTLEGGEFLRPFTKAIPSIGPGQTQTVTFEIPTSSKIKGSLLIKNYGRVYIDILENI